MDDNQAITDAAQAYADAWNNHDASSFSTLFLEDADFCNFQGAYIKGREGIIAAHQFIFEHPFKNTALKHLTVMISIRSSDMAIYRSKWEMTGNNADGSPMETRTGMFIFVLQKIEGKWKIAAGQNTEISVEQVYKGGAKV